MVPHCGALAVLVLSAATAGAVDGLTPANMTDAVGSEKQLEYQLDLSGEVLPMKSKVLLAGIYVLGLNWVGCDRCYIGNSASAGGLHKLLQFGVILGTIKGSILVIFLLLYLWVSNVADPQNKSARRMKVIVLDLSNAALLAQNAWVVVDYVAILKNMLVCDTNIEFLGFDAKFLDDTIIGGKHVMLLSVLIYIFLLMLKFDVICSSEKYTTFMSAREKAVCSDPDESCPELYHQLPA